MRVFQNKKSGKYRHDWVIMTNSFDVFILRGGNLENKCLDRE